MHPACQSDDSRSRVASANTQGRKIQFDNEQGIHMDVCLKTVTLAVKRKGEARTGSFLALRLDVWGEKNADFDFSLLIFLDSDVPKTSQPTTQQWKVTVPSLFE